MQRDFAALKTNCVVIFRFIIFKEWGAYDKRDEIDY